MACSIVRDNTTGEIKAVLAPNSKRSILYSDLLSLEAQSTPGALPSKEKVLKDWAVAYTPGFKQWSGDWEQGPTNTSVTLDENGEPVMNALMDYATLRLGNSVEVKPPRTPSPSSLYKLNYTLQKMQEIFPELKYRILSSTELPKFLTDERDLTGLKVNAFVKGDTIYFDENAISDDLVLEEFLHPFVNTLHAQRPNLFKGLYNNGGTLYGDIQGDINNIYTDERGFSELDRQKEFVTRLLQQSIKDRLNGKQDTTEEEKTYSGVLDMFLQWLRNTLYKLSNAFSLDAQSDLTLHTADDKMTLARLPEELTLDELSNWLLSGDGMAMLSADDLILDTNTYYNTTPDDGSDQEDAAKEDNYRTMLKERKMARIDQQIAVLNKQMKVPGQNSKIVRTLLSLRASQERYKELLDEDKEKTRNVTTIIGTSNMDAVPGTETYAHLGTFVHAIMEETQLLAMKDESGMTAPVQVFNREMFDKMWEEYPDKFTVPGLSMDLLYSNAVKLLGYMTPYYNNGENIVLPEMTVFARNSNGVGVIGRIDFMVIDKQGKVTLVDLKTTKFEARSFNDHIKHKYPLTNPKEGADGNFVHLVPKRSKLMSYHAQLSVYEQMLKQNNIDVVGKDVLGFFMQGEHDEVLDPVSKQRTKTFTYHRTHMALLRANDYAFIADSRTGDVIKDITYSTIEQAARKAIPAAVDEIEEEVISDEEREAQEERQRKANMSEFEHLSDAITARLTKQLNNTLSNSIRNLDSIIKKADDFQSDPEKKQYYQERKQQLYKVQEVLNREGITDNIKLQVSMSALLADYNIIHERFKLLKDKAALTSASDQTRAFVDIMRQQAAVKELFGLVRNVLIDNNNKRSDSGDKLIEELDAVLSTIQEDESAYFNLGADAMVKLLRQENPEGISEKIAPNATAMLTAHRDKLLRDASELENEIARMNGAAVPPTGNIASETYRTVKNSVKNTIRTVRGEAPKSYLKSLMEELDYTRRHIEQINFNLQDNGVLTDEKLNLYVRSLYQNSDSVFYLGAKMGGDIMGTSIDDFYAAKTSPELLLSSVSGYLVELTRTAQEQFSEELHQIKWQSTTDNFIKKHGGPKQASDLISESVKRRQRDADTGVVEDKQHRAFRSPKSQLFYDIFDEFVNTTKDKRDELKVLNKQKRDSPTTDPELEKTIKKKRQELNQHRQAFQAWSRKNVHMPFVDEVYDIVSQIPEDIQEELDELQSQIDAIMGPKGFNNEETLVEDELDIMQGIKIKMQSIRREASLQNPNYEKALLAREKYFTQDINNGLFKRLEASKHAQYVIQEKNPEEYNKWLKRNTVTTPRQEWYDEINAIFTEMGDLMGEQDSVVGDLLHAQREILRKYKVEREFDARFMTEQDVKLYEQIQAQLKTLQEQAKQERDDEYNTNLEQGIKLTPKERAKKLRMKELLSRLSEMRTEKVNEKYEQDYNKRLTKLSQEAQAVRDIKDKWSIETNPVEKDRLEQEHIAAEKSYFTMEEEFKIFFEKYNTTKYEPGSVLIGTALELSPKKFLISMVPANPNDYETLPNSKYRTRRYTKEAYNEDYQEDHDGYPMLKGMEFDKTTNRYNFTGNNDYFNPEFLNMMRDAETYDFYNYLVMDNYIKQQSEISGRKLGFLYPGVQENGIQDIRQNGKEGLKRQWFDTVDGMRFVKSEQEKQSNEYGQSADLRVKFRHNFALEENLTTKDGINAVLKWKLGAKVNMAMAEADLELTPTIDYLNHVLSRMDSSDPRTRKVQRLVDHVNFERNKMIYGQMNSEANSNTIGGRIAEKFDNTWLNRRNMKVLFKAISFTRLGFDIALQGGNLISGNVQAFLNTSPLRHADEGDYLWSKGELYRHALPNLLTDYGKAETGTFYGKFYRYLNPMQKDPDKLFDMSSQSRKDRILNRFLAVGDLGFSGQDKGELEIGMTTALMLYHNSKYKVFEVGADKKPILDAAGNNVYKKDSKGLFVYAQGPRELFYENDRGGISPREDIDFTPQDERLLRNRVHNEIIRVQGNYSDYTKSRAESFVMGQLILFYRKYVPSVLTSRFGGALSHDITDQIDWQTGELYMGWYTAMFRMFQYYGASESLKAFLPGVMRNKLGITTTVAPYLLMKKDQAMKEVVAATVSMLLYGWMRGLVMGPDKEKLTWVEMMAMKTMIKVTNETRSVVIFPRIGKPDEYINLFTTLTTSTREFKTLFSALGNIWGWAINDPDAFYKKKTGRFDKGDPKALKNLQELSGIDNFINLYNPRTSLEQAVKPKE